jgi:hypothetical protein
VFVRRALGVLEPERPALPVSEEVDPVDPQAQAANLGIEQLMHGPHGFFGSDGVQELGARLDAHCREVAAGGEADAGHLVVEAEAVLAPPVGSDPKGEIADRTRGRPLGFARPGPGVLEPGQQTLGQLGPPREVERVDAGRQLPQARLGKMRICD